MSSEIILKMDEIPNAREKKKDVVKIPKKKGRKLTPLLLYISQSKVKIKAWRVEMNKPGIFFNLLISLSLKKRSMNLGIKPLLLSLE